MEFRVCGAFNYCVLGCDTIVKRLEVANCRGIKSHAHTPNLIRSKPQKQHVRAQPKLLSVHQSKTEPEKATSATPAAVARGQQKDTNKSHLPSCPPAWPRSIMPNTSALFPKRPHQAFILAPSSILSRSTKHNPISARIFLVRLNSAVLETT